MEKGYECVVLTRSVPKDPKPGIKYAEWDVAKKTIDKEAIATADYIIHLAGANVAEKRWTPKRKKEIVDSRTESTDLLIESLRSTPNQLKAFISASAIGYYGADTERSKRSGFKEDDPPANDFLGSTCRQWEESVWKAAEILKVRTVIFRQGIVLTKEEGALEKFKQPLKFGLATILGNGRQTISWIHVHDLCRMYLEALKEPLSGRFNAVAPQTISNKEFVLSLAKHIRKTAFIPVHVPSFVLKTVLGEMSIEVLKSATVNCDKIKSTGFRFLYPSVEPAFTNLLKT